VTKRRGRGERFLSLRYWMLDSPAWKSLPPTARALYPEVARRYNGGNNGRISYSVREAAQALNVSIGTGKYLLDMLQDRGFIVPTKRGYFTVKTDRDATEWRLTEHSSDNPPAFATKDFMRWRAPEDGPESVTEFRKRFTRMNRTVHSSKPNGSPQYTGRPQESADGSFHYTVDAQNNPSTVHSSTHLQLPGEGGLGRRASERARR
jgi:hypothetical protein